MYPQRMVWFSTCHVFKTRGRGLGIVFIVYRLLCVASRFQFYFFRVRFCVDGRGAAAGLGLVEDRHDFETESTTRKMQVGKKERN